MASSFITFVVVIVLPLAVYCVQHHEEGTMWTHDEKTSSLQAEHKSQCPHEAIRCRHILCKMLVTNASNAPNAEFVGWGRGETLGKNCSVNGSLAAEKVHNSQVTVNGPQARILHSILL